MKLISILPEATKAALGVCPKRQSRPPLPERLAHRKGVIPPKLLAFEGAIERNRVGKEVRRWLRSELPEHHLSAQVFNDDVLNEAVRRLMVYGDKPADALVMSAAFCIMP